VEAFFPFLARENVRALSPPGIEMELLTRTISREDDLDDEIVPPSLPFFFLDL